MLHGEDGAVAGLLVDAVREVLRVPEDAIALAAGRRRGRSSRRSCAHGDEFVSLLDLDRVLDLGELSGCADVRTAGRTRVTLACVRGARARVYALDVAQVREIVRCAGGDAAAEGAAR